MVICDEPSGPFVYSLEHVRVRYCVGVPNAASIIEDGEHKGIVALFFYFAGAFHMSIYLTRDTRYRLEDLVLFTNSTISAQQFV